MKRLLNLLLLFGLLAGALWMFEIKTDSEDLAALIAQKRREIVAERDKISILEAEWSLLNRPERLQRLSEQFEDELQLQIPDLWQIVKLTDVPPRALYIDETGEAGQTGGQVAGIVTTGGGAP